MTEIDGILVLLLVVIAALVWLAYEARSLHDSLAPILESRLAGALASL